MSKTFLLTGATGFVGSNLARKLCELNHKVIAIKRSNSSLENLNDIQDKIHFYDYDGNVKSLEIIFQDYKNIEATFHIASWYLRDHQAENINDLLKSNINFSTNLIEVCTKNNCNKFINTTSFTEFDEAGHYNPDSLYSATKKAFRDILQYYVKARKISALTLVLYDNYSVNDNRKKLLWLLEDAYKNDKPIDFTKGEQKLCLVNIVDTISGYLQAYELLCNADYQNKNLLYFLAGKPKTLKEIVEEYIEITGRKININWGAIPYRENQIMSPYIGQLLPNWQAKINFKEGLLNKSVFY